MSDQPQQYSLLFGSMPADIKHTFGHVDCPACEATQARVTLDVEKYRKMQFGIASPLWLKQRERYLRPRTYQLYGQHIKHAAVFFGDTRLKNIHIGQIREYQDARTRGFFTQIQPDGSEKVIRWKRRAGPSLVNHEVIAVAGVLKEAGEWENIKPLYEALPMGAWRPQKVMTEREEIMVWTVLRQLAEEKRTWTTPGRIAYLTASLTCNTGASGTELRNMRIRDVSLETRGFVCWDDTTKNRGRALKLNATAETHLRECLEIAQKNGSYLPEHYVFPFRVNRCTYDPMRCATESWLRRGYAELRTQTGFKWLTPHCWRHQYATLRIDAGHPLEQVKLDMGHKDTRMTSWYYHQRGDRQKQAVDDIDPLKRFAPKVAPPALHLLKKQQA